MRGIGKGQTLLVLVAPEILNLVATAMTPSSMDTLTHLERLRTDLNKGNLDQDGLLLPELMGWLVLNGMRSEKIQFNLLSEQRLANIWRKNAYRELCGDARRRVGSVAATPRDRASLDVFRERLDYRVENTIPTSVDFHVKLTALVECHRCDYGCI